LRTDKFAFTRTREREDDYSQEEILEAKKVDKKHMNAGACEVKPLHLAMGFRKAVAEYFPGHYTGPLSTKEMGQWKLFHRKGDTTSPRTCH